MRFHKGTNALLAALLLVVAIHPAGAQSDTAGSVFGRVSGPGGQAIAGARVRIESVATGEHADAVSGPRGAYHFAGLQPGSYRVFVRAQGWSDWEADNLAVGLGTQALLNAALAPPSLHRTILVDAAAQSSPAETGGMSQDALKDLPNNGQHWSSLAALFGANASDASGRVSFRGLSPLLNSIALDGMNHTLAFRSRERGTAGNGFATGQSVVSQFQAGSNGFIAPSGHGGETLVSVTRSGADHMRGQAVFYDRGAIGQTRNAYTRTMQAVPAGTTEIAGQPVMYLNGQPITYVDVPYHAPDRRQQWEVSAGGPIRRERAFWFFSWEQHVRVDPAIARANQPEVFFFTPSASTLATLEARLQGSRHPIATRCAGTGESGGGSTAMAACAYATVLNQLNGMLGTVQRSTRQTNIFPRLDWRLNARNQIVLQYNSMRRTAPHGALSGASETSAAGSFGNSSTSDDAAIAQWEYFASPEMVNNLRWQYSRDLLAQMAAAQGSFAQQFAGNSWGLPPQVSIDRSQGFSFGTLPGVDKRKYPEEKRQQIVDTFTWMRGRQMLRFGYDFNHVTDVLEGLNGETGTYSYSSLLNFISDMLSPDSCDASATAAGPYPCYSEFRQTLGYPQWWFSTADYAAFAAEDWKTGHGLTLSFGLRYEYEHLPDTNSALVNASFPRTAKLPHNFDELGPRAGFSWDVLGSGRTVLRGGFGIYYARVPNAMAFSALTSTGTTRSPRSYVWRPMDEGAPAFPWVFASTATPYVDPGAPDYASTAPAVVYFDRDFRHPQIVEMQLALEQGIGRRTLLTVTGMATDGHRLSQFVDTNIDPAAVAQVFYAVKAPGNGGNLGPLAKKSTAMAGLSAPIYQPQRFYYARLNRAYGPITDIVSETNSSYRGLMVRLLRRMSHSLTLNAGYTWAHAIDDNQNEATFAQHNSVYDPADPGLEHGTSNFDVRERVSGAVVLRTPWHLHGTAESLLGGYALAATGDWHKGLPYTMRTLGPVPAPACSYQNWLIAGGASSGGANCLKAVQQPGGVIVNGAPVPIASLGTSLNGAGGEDLIPGIGRNTFRYPASVNLDLRFIKTIRFSDRYALDLMGEAFNALNHQNVTGIESIGYRIGNDPQHANMATLTWQSGEKPTTSTVLVNGGNIRQYAFDATAAFGGVTNANSRMLGRERQIQAGLRLHF